MLVKTFTIQSQFPAVQYGYNVYNDNDEWCGVILYGGGANNNMPKSFGKNAGEVLELVRVALNGKQETTSKAVAMSLKQLHKENPLCEIVVSYADHRQKTSWHDISSNKLDLCWQDNNKRHTVFL